VCKKSITNSQPFVKKMKKCQVPKGGIFFDSHCRGATSNTVDYDYINLMTVIIKQAAFYHSILRVCTSTLQAM